MKYFMQFGILCGMSLAGELLQRALGLPVPGNVLGMLLLLVCLQCGIIKPAQVEGTARMLVGSMALLFVPMATGLMTQAHTLWDNLLLFLLVNVVLTVLVMGITGRVVQGVRRAAAKRGGDADAARVH